MSEATETPENDDPESLRSLLEAAIPEEDDSPVTEISDAETEKTEAQPPQEAEPEAVPEGAQEGAQEDAAPASAESGAGEQGQLFDADHPGDAERYPNLTAERAAKAPSGWRPAAREGWESLPEPVRREIHRREMDISEGLQQSTHARQFQDRFQKQMQPYTALMQAEGAKDPLQAVEQLMATAATLNMGSPAQKAQRMAQLIGHYGVDVNALADAIDGNASPEAQVPDPYRAALDARMAPVEKMMEMLDGRLRETARVEHESMIQEMDTFAEQNEFFEDVREEMADLWEVRNKRGEPVTLQQLYDIACQTNPGIQKALSTRAAQNSVLSQEAATQRKLAAASASRAPSPVGNGASRTSSTGDRRSDIAAAWSSLENG